MPTNWKYWDADGEHDWEDPDSELPDETFLYYEPFQQQFVDRVNEIIMLAEPIRRGLGNGTLALVPDASGADMQALSRYRTWWARLRDAVRPPAGLFYTVVAATSVGGTLPTLAGGVGSVPVWGSLEDLAAEAGLDFDGNDILTRQANNDEDAPVFELRAMQQGDRVGKWVFEDLRRFTSRIRYMIGKLTSVVPFQELGIPAVKYKHFSREEEAASSKDYAEYTAAWAAEPWVTSNAVSTTQKAHIEYISRRRLGWQSQQYHLRHAWRYHSGVVAQEHQWRLYMLPRAAGIFRDDEALGLTEDVFKLLNEGTDTGPGYHDEGTYYGSEVALADVAIIEQVYGFLTQERAWLVMGMDQVYVG